MHLSLLYDMNTHWFIKVKYSYMNLCYNVNLFEEFATNLQQFILMAACLQIDIKVLSYY